MQTMRNVVMKAVAGVFVGMGLSVILAFLFTGFFERDNKLELLVFVVIGSAGFVWASVTSFNGVHGFFPSLIEFLTVFISSIFGGIFLAGVGLWSTGISTEQLRALSDWQENLLFIMVMFCAIGITILWRLAYRPTQ